MPELAPNVVVAGRFRLNRKLGQGGMGSVWHATQLGLDTPCALKFIEGDFAMVPEMQARFEREAKAAAALRSPHVVAIIDHSIWDGTPFIAMELLDGEDLRHRLERVGRLSPQQTIEVLGQVCRALTKAHGIGIVHRDLKPDNIYLCRDDDREIAKVLDFGIAKSNKAGLDTGGNTKTGAMLGTPYYMSPEQAQGTKSVDFHADLWSMAVIAFQCVTGKLPFESEALGDLLMKIMVAPLPVPSQVASVPPSFDAWWIKAASRDPHGRFGSAKEFIETLTQALTATVPVSYGAAHSGEGSGQWQLPQGQVSAPNPTMALGPQTPNPAAPPLARTFADGSEGVPKSSSMPIVIGVVGVLLLGGVGATAYVMKGSGDAKAVASGGQASATVTSAPTNTTPTASAPTNTTPTASATAATSASAAPSAGVSVASLPTAHATTTKPTSSPHVATTPTTRPTATATTAPTATSTANKKPDTLGF